MKRTLLTFMLLAMVSSIYALTPKILFYGYVEEGNIERMFAKNETPPKLNNVQVTVTQGNEEIKVVKNRKTGFYSVILETGISYQVKFEKEGFITKIFEIDGSTIPDGDFEESFKMFTDITLFPRTNAEEEHTLWSSPVAKCSFQYETKRLVWDMRYARIAFDHFLRVAGVKDNFTVN